jgi:dTMP kinase
MYITLEGIDGSGKSTQILMLAEWLESSGLSVKVIKEPTDSLVGVLIRKMLRNPSATQTNFQRTLVLLFAADRIILMEKIREEEEKGNIVLSDRSFYSSLAYQEGDEWITQVNKHAREPDLVVLLDLETETALKRCEGKDSFEKRGFLDKIRNKYLELSDKHEFMVVNAENGINKVHADIKKIVAPKLGLCF